MLGEEISLKSNSTKSKYLRAEKSKDMSLYDGCCP